MSPAFRKLLEAGPPSPEAIDAFLADRRVPIVEGSTVTFLYRGPADAVYLQQQNYSLAALARRDEKDDPFASGGATPAVLTAMPQES